MKRMKSLFEEQGVEGVLVPSVFDEHTTRKVSYFTTSPYSARERGSTTTTPPRGGRHGPPAKKSEGG